MKSRLKLTPKKDLSAVSAFLLANNLPVSDLEEENVNIYAIYIKEELVATIGMEQYGNSALLRSLAVKEIYRNQHLADEMIKSFFKLCHAKEITDVYLLTTTADRYFDKKGFLRIGREKVPTSIRQTHEFTSICPSSAVVMHRRILPN